jgi:hypothetical protein
MGHEKIGKDEIREKLRVVRYIRVGEGPKADLKAGLPVNRRRQMGDMGGRVA